MRTKHRFNGVEQTMNNLKKEQEQWEEETNPITEETINEMCEYYEKEEEEEDENEVEIKELPLSLDFGELRHLGYDY